MFCFFLSQMFHRSRFDYDFAIFLCWKKNKWKNVQKKSFLSFFCSQNFQNSRTLFKTITKFGNVTGKFSHSENCALHFSLNRFVLKVQVVLKNNKTFVSSSKWFSFYKRYGLFSLLHMSHCRTPILYLFGSLSQNILFM